MMSPTATATAVFLSAAPSSFSTRRRRSRLAAISASLSPSSSDEPLLVRAARGEDGLPRPPAWMMRQAGRYMAEYQALAKRHPSFRERSENTDLIVEITLQPWRAFAPDGVILFSDILTPLPAIGVPFDISDSKGPVIQSPVRSEEQIVSRIKTECPHVPLVLYINGNGGLLERMKDTGVDVIGLDWTVDMADGRRRLGNGIGVQGNVDPACLFAPLPVITDEIHRVVKSAGPKGHILNLGHGVLQKTPEEAVAHFFDVTRSLRYDTLFQGSVAEELQPVA
nr:unnamed protein product [Digitaria exilis]